MKKRIALICILAMLLVPLGTFFVGAEAAGSTVPAGASKWDGTVPEANKAYVFEGEGTEASPWLIKSAADLAQLAANVRLNDKETTYAAKFFKLTVDIDIDNKGWWAIGGCHIGTDGLSTKAEDDNRFSYFAGTFDGDNHKIYNLALANTTEVVNPETNQTETKDLHQQGLFGVIMGATIKNLGIESGNIQLENSNRSAAFCGVGRCGFLIENCYNKANVTLTSNFKYVYVGAFFGQVIDKWDISANTENNTEGVFRRKEMQKCYNTGNLTVTLNQPADSEFRIGSIAGQYVGGAPTMIDVYSVCDVTVTSNSEPNTKSNHSVGGITGALLDSGFIDRVYFKGKVTFTAPKVTDMAKYQIAAMVGNMSATTTADVDDQEHFNNGFCLTEGSTATKAVGNREVNFCFAVDNVVIPLAENSDFIVNIHAEEKPPVNPPETTGDEKETDPPKPTTTAPKDDETKKPGTTEGTTEAATTGTPDKEKSGCSSVMGMGAVMLIAAVASGAGICFTVRKKKEN